MKSEILELVKCPGCDAIICLKHGFVWIPPVVRKK